MGQHSSASGSALLYATYLSGNGLTIPQGIAIDAAGNIFTAEATLRGVTKYTKN